MIKLHLTPKLITNTNLKVACWFYYILFTEAIVRCRQFYLSNNFSFPWKLTRDTPKQFYMSTCGAIFKQNWTETFSCTKFSLIILAFAFTHQNSNPVVVLQIRSCVAPSLLAQLDRCWYCVDTVVRLYESP